MLFGDVSPAARLPLTFANRLPFLNNAGGAQYPGIDNKALYSEGVYVGYRAYNNYPQLKNGVVRFPFGFGLSYTTFYVQTFSCSAADDGTVEVTIALKNTGAATSSWIAMLYATYPTAVTDQPAWQLVAFDKFHRVQPRTGSLQRITFDMRQELSVWNVNTQAWELPSGTYTIGLGDDSRNMRNTCMISV